MKKSKNKSIYTTPVSDKLIHDSKKKIYRYIGIYIFIFKTIQHYAVFNTANRSDNGILTLNVTFLLFRGFFSGLNRG